MPFDENRIKITEENSNRIAAADAFTSNSKEVSTDTSNSIWVDLNDSLEYRKGNGSNAITASQKIARDIAASSQAIQNSQSGTSEIAGQILAIERADGIPWQDVESLGRPDTEASEHLIWFFPSEGKVFKATAYGRFGHSISKGSGKNSPLEYLRRIAATNEAFDDTATIIGKFRHPDGALGLVHAQDFIVRKKGSKKITFSEIERFLLKNGFLKDERREAVFVNKDIGIEVADAHPGNFIKAENSTLVPIDVLAFKFDETKEANYSIAIQPKIERVNAPSAA